MFKPDSIFVRVPDRYMKVFSVFNVCSSSKNCLSVRYTSVINAVFGDVDVFGTKNVSLNHIS
jgi:hypothetical protein